MQEIREEIRLLIRDQYEVGWRTTSDIELLTDKILAVLNQRLDLVVEPIYNGFHKKGK